MSVEVKTPTRVQFEHAEFPCGEIKQSPSGATKTVTHNESKSEETNGSKTAYSPAIIRRKRSQYRSTSSAAKILPIDDNPGKPLPKRRKSMSNPKKDYKLPSKFLLGGNINDPLNLRSLCEDEEINKLLNAKTPASSPLPIPAHRQQVDVIIPINIKDPLNLNAPDEDSTPKSAKKKHKRNKHRKKSEKGDLNLNAEDIETSTSESNDINVFKMELTVNVTAGNEQSTRKVKDPIVSPVCPQTSPRSKRGKRKSDEFRPECSSVVSRALLCENKDKSEKHVQFPVKSTMFNKQTSKHFRSNDQKFVYGNYNRYYGYRNTELEADPRLNCLKTEWIDGKDILDIGCNVGHVTLAIAKKFQPARIVGLDIDGKLISAAKKNIRHYISSEKSTDSKFPVSMSLCYGPVGACSVPNSRATFPNNVAFVQGNYVLDHDELLELQKEEYDVIFALSITKWIHVNTGDDGLKRAFKRMYKQLRPGGKLILEPQGWASYKKKKKLTEEIFKTFQSIKFRPEQFTEYLLSIGFSTCENIATPYNKAKGFQRPIQVYTKSDAV